MSGYGLLVAIHATAGGLGALIALVPLATLKGGRGHRRGGMAFSACMALTAATGLWIALIAVARSDHGIGPPLVLVTLAIAVGSATWRGYRSGSRRGERGTADSIVCGLVLLGALLVSIPALRAGRWPALAFASVLALAAVRDGLRWPPIAWRLEHAGANMLALLGALSGFLALRGWVAGVPVLLIAGGAAFLAVKRSGRSRSREA